MLKMDVIIQQKPCSRNMEIPGGRGSSKAPLEWKFLRGGGCKPKKPSVGGVWIFSGTT